MAGRPQAAGLAVMPRRPTLPVPLASGRLPPNSDLVWANPYPEKHGPAESFEPFLGFP